MPSETALTVSLAEFGLGKYEAQAYVTLLTKGVISASNLAYYSTMPRTKVYPVMRRLEKKGLVTMTHSKPVMCSAIVPQESFDEIIGEQINKVNAMNALVEDLKALCASAKQHRKTQERKYAHIDHSEVLRHTQEMIQGAASGIRIMADQSGLGLLFACTAALGGAAKRGVKITIMLPPSAVGTDELRSIARIGDIRISEIEHNCIVFDDANVLITGGNGGKAALFESSEILADEQARFFASAWRGAVRADALAIMSKTAAQEAYRAIRLVEKSGLYTALQTAKPGNTAGMMALLDEGGIRLGGRKLDDVVLLVDAAVRTVCSGSVTHDSKRSKILVSSALNSGHSLPWARIIEGYLDSRGIKTRLVYQNRTRRGEQVHIKMN